MPYWLQSTAKIFDDHRQYTLDAADSTKHRIFIDRGSDILFVAHLDTVLPPKLIRPRGAKRIYAHGLDDRLGCCIAAILSEKLGADLLLTDHEETCRSTAEFHELKDYNWIAEFDREGQDVVTYNMDSKAFCDALSQYWTIGIGAFSDICSMKTDVCCVNIGIGHKFSHSKDSYVCVKALRKQVKLFLEFYARYKNTEFKQDYRITDEYGYNASDDGLCDICGWEYGESIYGYTLCYSCLMEVFNGVLK